MRIKELRMPYFNQQFNVYIDTYDEVKFPEMNGSVPVSGGTFHHGYDAETGIATFGIWSNQERDRPGHGGLWSSRESIAGPIMGLKLVGVAINMFGVSMTVEKLNEILPDIFEIVPRFIGGSTLNLSEEQLGHSEGKEIVYVVQRKDGKTGPGAPYSGTKPITYRFDDSGKMSMNEQKVAT